MKFRQFAILSLALLMGGLFVLAQTDLTGFWVLRVPRGDGTFNETFFDLKQSGEAITGEMVGGRGKVAIQEGSVKDGKIHFAVPGGRGFGGPPPGGPPRAGGPGAPGAGGPGAPAPGGPGGPGAGGPGAGSPGR